MPIPVGNEVEAPEYMNETLGECLSLDADLNEKVDQAESVQNQSNNTPFSPTVMQPISNVPPPIVSHSARQLPVSDWGSQFSGDSKDLYNFIDRASEYAEAGRLTKVKLFKAAAYLFSDNVFLWFL
ncbi:hypothetical protein JTB14_002938 [Gonioctena quinquepunctata]|nr:hypothetical protein JTB14_002938 [Gonioctena quinquepunctata]